MIQIVKSLLGKNEIEFQNELQIILSDENKNTLFPDEIDVFKYLSKEYSSNKQFPTEEVFLIKFPQYRAQLNETDAFALCDLRYYRKQFITKKQNLSKSKLLHKLANDALSNGISPEMLETIRKQSSFEEVVQEDNRTFRERYTNSMKENSGLLTYIDLIDEQIGSITKGSVCTLAGFTGCGKTTWAVNMAIKNVLYNKKNIAYISLEVTKEQLEYSIMSLFSNDPRFTRLGYSPIKHQEIRQSKLQPDDLNFLCDVLEPEYRRVIEPNFHILDESKFKTFSESEILDVLYKLDDEKPLDAVFFDHAGLFAFKSPLYNSGNVGVAINKYVSFIRQISIAFRIKEGKTCSIASVLLAQTNRSGWKEATKSFKQLAMVNRPGKNKGDVTQVEGYKLSALSDANELERCSSVVLSVFTDGALKESGQAYVQMLKTRYGNEVPPTAVNIDLPYYVFGDKDACVDESELSVDLVDSLANSTIATNNTVGTNIIDDEDPFGL